MNNYLYIFKKVFFWFMGILLVIFSTILITFVLTLETSTGSVSIINRTNKKIEVQGFYSTSEYGKSFRKLNVLLNSNFVSFSKINISKIFNEEIEDVISPVVDNKVMECSVKVKYSSDIKKITFEIFEENNSLICKVL